MSLGSAVGVGDSWLHRTPAAVKLAGMLVGSILIVALRSPLTLGIAAILVVVLYASAGLLPRGLWRQVGPLRWFVAFLVPFQWVTTGWRTMVEVVGVMLVAVALAGLVTETTRLSDMMAALVRGIRPLRIVGIDPDRVALVLSLTIRSVPVITHVAQEAFDARKARGQERSVRAVVTPVVIRTIRHAERTGEALTARGYDD